MTAQYPNLALIRYLRAKFISKSYYSLSATEAIDLINHQHERIAQLEAELNKIKGSCVEMDLGEE